MYERMDLALGDDFSENAYSLVHCSTCGSEEPTCACPPKLWRPESSPNNNSESPLSGVSHVQGPRILSVSDERKEVR